MRSSPRTRPKLLRLLLIAVGVALFILVFFGGKSGLFRILSLERKRQSLLEEITALKVQTELLRLKKTRLERDLGYLKRIARQEYGMVKADSGKTK